MRIEIQDKDFWIQQCSLAIKNIQEEYQRKQKLRRRLKKRLEMD